MKDYSFGVIPTIKEDGELFYLLIQHTGDMGGHWSFPKGHKEGNESDTEAAKREFTEETGIREIELSKDIFFIEQFSFDRHGQTVNKTVKYFLGKVKNRAAKVQESEIKDFAWLPYEEARKRLTFPQVKTIIEKANNLHKSEIS